MTDKPKCLSTGRYHVAWISAIGKEYLIACAMLDEKFGIPVDLPEDDENGYTFGRIGSHNVVLASLPKGKVGVEQAGRLATDMTRSFKRLRFGLMVGIAGGAPSKDVDIRLGDVVVSTPNDSKRLGGVVHYGFGASVQESSFQRRGSLNSPPDVLLNAVALLEKNYGEDGHKIEQKILDVVEQKTPRLDHYRRPTTPDLLFKPAFLHPSDVTDCTKVCHAVKGEIVPRRPRSDESLIAIHHGVVGSASNLMRDATLRDKIAKEDGVLCYEMESAGLMNSRLGWLVVRGICDYADTHKNDDWQSYAAAVAAVYAQELLEVIRPRVELDNVFDVAGAKHEDRQIDVLQLLRYENMYAKWDFSRPEDTYNQEWIWSTVFSEWIASSSDVFWICGKPGSGKSILVAYLVHSEKTREKLRSQSVDYEIIYFFYDYRAGGGLANNTTGMLIMFLYQLADRFQASKSRLDALLKDGRLNLDSIDSLTDAFYEALRAPGRRFCVFIDGLDEYEGNHIQMLQMCRRLQERTGIKLCLVSRPEVQVPKIFNFCSEIIMQDHNNESMYAYAKESLLRAANNDPFIERRCPYRVQDELVRKAEGIILWFKLAFDELVVLIEADASEDEIVSFLEDVPIGLDAMYERILGRVKASNHQEAAFYLYLVSQLRVLRMEKPSIVNELSTDLDLFGDVYSFTVEKFGDTIAFPGYTGNTDLRARVKYLLRDLIEIYKNCRMRFIHETFNAYLTRTGWPEHHMNPALTDRYPDSFWLRLSAQVTEQASMDALVNVDILERCINECERGFLAGLALHYQDSVPIEGEAILRCLAYLLKERKSSLIAVMKQFMPFLTEPLRIKGAQEIGLWRSRLFELYRRIISHGAKSYFPVKLNARHVLVSTSASILLNLAYRYEKKGFSSLNIVAPALQSNLNSLLLLIALVPINDLAVGMTLNAFHDTEMKAILDVLLAVMAFLPHYFAERVDSIDLSDRQKDFLMQASLATCLSTYPKNSDILPQYLNTLAAKGRYIRSEDLCFLLTQGRCIKIMAGVSEILKHYLPPEPSSSTERAAVHCQNCPLRSRHIGLLYHWAQLSCWSWYKCFLPSEAQHFKPVLDLLVRSGEKINENCYRNGNVLHAVLDVSIKPRRDRDPLSRMSKLRALAEVGIDPKIMARHGDGLQVAQSSLRKLRLGRLGVREDSNNIDGDRFSMEAAVKYLEFHVAHGNWPTTEEEVGLLGPAASRSEVLS